ncbi:hypothetical protein [Treponema sp.]|uniref:hypothetical protein n=1 Tax=Treponema sp. TaxID=166 RepID=UPI00298E7B23|nr:hypothetical protein [Treponema sp.]MCQ2240866.1 hypothetical protein [Treponema sp.]
MIQLVTIEDNSIFLNTNMTTETFAKTRFLEKIKEKGVLAELNEGKWKYEPWTFDSTEEKNGMMLLRGTAFKGKIAGEVFESGTEKEIHSLSIVLCDALENAKKSVYPLANIGAGGILVSDDLKKILFLPYTFWTTAVMSAGDETSCTANGKYINQNLDRECALGFTQAVLVYKTIAGSFPFTEEDATKRFTDMMDENYIPLKWTIPGVNKKITSFTEKAFAMKHADFPSDEFSTYSKSETSEDELAKFRRDAESKIAGKKRHVESKRFVRAKQTVITAISIATVIILIIAGHLRKTALDKPTSKSLTSLETLEMYYNSVNELNVDAVKNCTEELSSRVDAISDLFLKSRTRSMYNRQTDTIPPASWLIKNQPLHNIFGISQFYVNGKEGSLITEGPRKKTRPKAITEEDGIQLKDRDEKNYSVEYILWDTTGEDLLAITKIKDVTKLTYSKDRWVVSDIQTIAETTEFRMSAFVDDYLACMKPESHDKADVLAACQSLKEKYSFTPTERGIDEGYQYLKKTSVFKVD